MNKSTKNGLVLSDKTEIGRLNKRIKLPEFKEQKLYKRYEEFVKSLKLNKEQKEKLMVVYSDYDEAVATAKEFDLQIKVPPKEQVVDNILALGKEKLETIAAIMGKPGLIIVPDKSLAEMKDSMNEHCHYDAQNEAYLATNYKWSGRPGKVSVSIIDMAQNTAVVPGQKPGEKRNDEQLRICEKYFRDNGMRLVSDCQYAAGMQQSLRAYEQARKKGEANPEKHILDFYGQPQKTVTIFNQEHNTAIGKVAYGDFSPESLEVIFNWSSPSDQRSGLRARGSVQVV